LVYGHCYGLCGYVFFYPYRYTAPVANFSRQAIQQNTNIEYINSSLPNVNELNLDIIQFTQHSDAIINNYVMCHNADDEDCTPFAYIAGSNCKILDGFEFSGSGQILEPKRGNTVTIKVPTGATSRTFPTLPPVKLPDYITDSIDSNFVNVNNNNTNNSNETITASHSGAHMINAHLLTLVAIVILSMY